MTDEHLLEGDDDEPRPEGRNVFIPNRVFHDYTDAKRFGRLIQLSQGSIDQINLDDIQALFWEKMIDMGVHAEDWILVSGAPLLNIIAAGLMKKHFGKVKLLQWNGVLREYYPFVME